MAGLPRHRGMCGVRLLLSGHSMITQQPHMSHRSSVNLVLWPLLTLRSAFVIVPHV